MTTDLKVARGFTLPLELVTEATAIVATRGAGKTYTSVVLIEEAYVANVPFCVIDATGVYHGLRSSADGGTKDGLPVYVIGGEHGDLPLEPDTVGGVPPRSPQAEMLAEVVATSGHSFVIDVSDFTRGVARRFVSVFLTRLYEIKARVRSPLLLVLDEADEWAPQKPNKDSAFSLSACELIVKRGRSRGLGSVLITQRTQALNKDVLDLIETLIAMRQGAERSREAVAGWISDKNLRDDLGVLDSLRSLPTGTAWVWSPVRGILEKVQVRRIRTFDSYATPKPGEAPVEPTARKELDLDLLGEKMRDAVQRARDSDPSELRARVRALEKQLAEKEQALGDAVAELADRPPEQVTVQVEVPVLSADHLLELTTAVNMIQSAAKPVVEALNKIIEAAEDQVPTATIRPAAPPPSRQVVPAPRRASRVESPSPVQRPESNGVVPRPQQKILDAIRWYEALNVPQPTRVQVAMMAAYSHSSGGYANLLGKLSSGGYVTYPSPGLVELTEQGRAVANEAGLPSTNEGVQQAVLARLPAPQQRLLSILISEWPNSLTREQLAEEAGYSPTSGGFANLLGKLRTGALIDYPDKGHVVALDVLFPLG